MPVLPDLLTCGCLVIHIATVPPLLAAGFDANDVHHAEVFMAQNVAVKDKVANARPPEVYPQRDAGKRVVCNSIPKRHLDHIQVLARNPRCLFRAVELKVIL